jgi:hypothetical protein
MMEIVIWIREGLFYTLIILIHIVDPIQPVFILPLERLVLVEIPALLLLLAPVRS